MSRHATPLTGGRTLTVCPVCPVCLLPGCEVTHGACSGDEPDQAIASPAGRTRLSCSACGEQLLAPAKLCGFCLEEASDV